jgi:hypothetical protein
MSRQPHAVTRAEFDELTGRVTQNAAVVEANFARLEIQFTRIAQMQADVDRLKSRLERLIGSGLLSQI